MCLQTYSLATNASAESTMQHCTGLNLELTEGHLDDGLQVGEFAQVSIGWLPRVGPSLGGDQAINRW